MTTQSFKTIELPRLVRGKPHGWNPVVCLNWGHQFMTFLKRSVRHQLPNTVWRVKFVPKAGASIVRLDESGVEDVVGGEERVGFLPKWYWEKAVGGESGSEH